MGSAFGTARSGTGIAAAAVMRPEGIMKSILPVVMAGVLYFWRKCDSFTLLLLGIIAIYGVVVAVLIAGQLNPHGYTLFQ